MSVGEYDLLPGQRDQLESIAKTEAAKRPTRLGPTKLWALRRAGLIYTAKHDDGRTFAHLTKRGRQELGLEVGLAR